MVKRESLFVTFVIKSSKTVHRYETTSKSIPLENRRKSPRNNLGRNRANGSVEDSVASVTVYLLMNGA